ncbi:MAG: hypothetical protein FRX48_05074 [Lasallia pustulata]|uniref:MYND-type domain-containing protein n=1 Tax=Lasallia pustulata TaxID=136370 RepID=A0A5M8PPA1_9LECA|nr:MAG: hypothetical protein FRX48_05074 [Lasallia pustulata]
MLRNVHSQRTEKHNYNGTHPGTNPASTPRPTSQTKAPSVANSTPGTPTIPTASPPPPLNAELQKAPPKCAVQPISLPLLTSSNPPKTTIQQLGLFATADIPPGDVVLTESSLLTANNRHLHPLCDACSRDLPPLTPSSHPYACPSCPDTVFCSAPCLSLAQTHYHPAICGKDIDAIGKDTAAPDAVNALYLLLLFRAVALAETQATHPLDLRETKYLWGDFVHPDRGYLHSASAAASPLSVARHLPFSFRFNVLAPLHVLEKMDVDVFAPTALRRYDG